MGLDAGPKSREAFRKTVLEAKTILWNGSPGVFEFDAFAEGSKALLEATVEAASKGATVIVGGGDTATVVAKYGAESKLSHVSTGGGAGCRRPPPSPRSYPIHALRCSFRWPGSQPAHANGSESEPMTQCSADALW